MPTGLGMMDARDVQRLREWHTAMAEADYDEAMRERESAIAGSDLYDRPCTDMNDRQCDYHIVAVFKLPLNEARRKRKSLRHRMTAWLRR